MAGYIGTQAVSVNTTSATISDDLAVGDDATVAGDLDVDGTTNLDVVDIDGAVNMATTALVTGVLTTTAATVFNGGFAAGGVGTFADGSAGAPSITNTGDVNTGMYFPAADRLGLSTAGTERVVLNAAHMGLETDGVYIQVAGSSNNFWAIGSTGGNNAPGTASTTLAFHHYNGSAWNNEIEFDASGNITLDGNLKVASGKGIDFSATGDGAGTDSSELLDDYEEGTWTVTVIAGYSNPSYAIQVGRYTKVGNTVRATFRCRLNGGTADNNGVVFTGLPYASVNDGSTYPVGTHYTNGASGGAVNSKLLVFPNDVRIYYYVQNAGGVGVISGATSGNDLDVLGQVVYEAA